MAQPPKTALITGITGQDGAYLARLLLSKGYAVHGTSRNAAVARLDSLAALGIGDRIKFHSMSSVDFQWVVRLLKQQRLVDHLSLRPARGFPIV